MPVKESVGSYSHTLTALFWLHLMKDLNILRMMNLMCPFIYPTWHFSHFSPNCCGVRQSSVSVDDSFGFWSLSTVGLMLLVCDKMPHKWRECAVEVTYCTYGDYWAAYLRILSDVYKKDLIFMISWCVTKVLEEDRSGGCIWYNAMNISINIKNILEAFTLQAFIWMKRHKL